MKADHKECFMQWKKFVLIGLVLCSTAALGAATDTKAGSRYVDPIQGFSMAAPAFIPPLTERTVVANFPVGIDGDFTSNINIIVDPVKTTRKEYVAAAIEALKVSNPKAVYNANKEMEVSGKEAQLIDFEANMGPAKRRLRFM